MRAKALGTAALMAFLVAAGGVDSYAQGVRRTGSAPGGVTTTLPDGAHDFDFTIGKWNIQQVGGGTATDTIKSFGSGIAITEKMRASGFSGNTVTVFDATTGLWTQTYLDNQGLYTQVTGGRDGDDIVLVGPLIDASGNRRLSRLRYTNITNRSFTQIGEESTDGGVKWTETFRLQFQKTN